MDFYQLADIERLILYLLSIVRRIYLLITGIQWIQDVLAGVLSCLFG